MKQIIFILEEFNKSILSADLSTQDLSKLHEDLKELHRNYFSANSSDRINFEENIITEVQQSKRDILKICILVDITNIH